MMIVVNLLLLSIAVRLWILHLPSSLPPPPPSSVPPFTSFHLFLSLFARSLPPPPRPLLLSSSSFIFLSHSVSSVSCATVTSWYKIGQTADSRVGEHQTPDLKYGPGPWGYENYLSSVTVRQPPLHPPQTLPLTYIHLLFLPTHISSLPLSHLWI